MDQNSINGPKLRKWIKIPKMDQSPKMDKNPKMNEKFQKWIKMAPKKRSKF